MPRYAEYREPPQRAITDLDEGERAPQIFGGSRPEGASDRPSGAEEISREDIQAIIRAELADAVDFYESEISPSRADATRYYKGEPFGDEEEGRSQVVSTDVRDTVLSILPSLMRIFCGPKRPVEFRPRGPEDEEAAQQRTDMVAYVIMEDNDGFKQYYTAFKDALIRKYAVFKWWWDDSVEVHNETYTGLLEEQVLAFEQDEDVTDVQYEQDGEIDAPDDGLVPPSVLQAPPDGAGAPPTPSVPQKIPTYTVRVKRERPVNKARFCVVPGEEFLTNREATGLKPGQFRIITHQREVTRSELVAMGYDPEFIDEHDGPSFRFQMNEEFLERRPEVRVRGQTPVYNKDLATTLYAEHLIPLDRDGDGIAELTKVCTIGDDFFVAKVEDAPEVNFAILCPDPEAHELFGLSIYDLVRDVQRIKSAVQRAMLDSLRQSIDPRIAVWSEFVDMDDMMNQEIGGVIRTERSPGEVLMPFTTDFVGREALGVLDYFDRVVESRTGRTKGSQGLDADAMQSTTKAAISAQLSAAQQRVELIARIFAEVGGFRDLFMGIQRLLMRHQDVPRTVKLRNKWVRVDPRTWDAPMDTCVTLALGQGAPEDQTMFLNGVVTKQEQVLQTLGPNPAVDYHRYFNTLRRAAEIAGYYDADLFFGELPPGWTPPPPPEKPDPALIVAQTEQQKAANAVQIEQMRLAFEREKLLLQTETDRMKIEADMQVKIIEIEAKNGAAIEEARVQQAIEETRMRTEANIRRMEAQVTQATRVYEAEQAAKAQAAAPAEAPGGGPA